MTSKRETEHCKRVGEGHAQRSIDRIFFSNLNDFLNHGTHEDVLAVMNDGHGG